MNSTLLISDDATTARRVRDMLDAMAYDVALAKDLDAVAPGCVAAMPSLALVDIEMRSGIGFESISVVRRLRPESFIVAFSRNDHQDLWLKVAEACGADTYVAGPLTASKLVSLLDGLTN